MSSDLTHGWWSGTFSGFLDASAEGIVEKLTYASNADGFLARPEQDVAWMESVSFLKSTADASLTLSPQAAEWGLVLEFVIPRRKVRPDAVLLAGESVVPIEFKVGATGFDRSSRLQAEEYAKDLRDFHSASHGREIFPVLVATAADQDDTNLDVPDTADRAQCVATPTALAELLLEIVERSDSQQEQIPTGEWSEASYQPSPGILEAALDIYAGHQVRELSHSYADELDATVEAVKEIVDGARREHERRICFITGVPGSGKTLAALNAVHEHAGGADDQVLGAYLSGNGPLVQVLRYAIAVDTHNHGDESMEECRRKAGTFIQPMHHFIEELGRLEDKIPPENVIVFDEAQRAWSQDKMAKKQGIEASEADTTLSIMERPADWAVVIAVIGEGQEIHDGEAGIEAWRQALDAHPDWEIYAPPEKLGNLSAIQDRFIPAEGLHLDVSVRSPRARSIAEWADKVVEGDLQAAREIAEAQPGFDLFVSRSLNETRAYLRDRARPDRRTGLLASSQARRLRPFGIEMDSGFQGGIDWGKWFVEPESDIRSSYALEVAASEFKCQGLEIDWAGICWGSDFTWNDELGEWEVMRLRGAAWVSDNNKLHARNRYRVLLTRARHGLVIWVPKPDFETLEVDSEALDRTADALISAGCKAIPT